MGRALLGLREAHREMRELADGLETGSPPGEDPQGRGGAVLDKSIREV